MPVSFICVRAATDQHKGKHGKTEKTDSAPHPAGHGTEKPDAAQGRTTEPKVDSGIGPAPEFFSEAMLAEWNRVAEFPWINASHRPTVIHHCVLFARLMEDATGGKPITASERQTFNSIQIQMGFTAAAASKVSAPTAAKEADPWAALG
jgi:hypothetical protein